ncbi:MAG: hypothetical protein ABIK10_05265 [candidate division WOR-3 bacterium]
MQDKAKYMTEKWLLKQPSYNHKAQDFYRKLLYSEYQLQTTLTSQVRKALATYEVPTIHYLAYHNYARHIFKILRRKENVEQKLHKATERWQSFGLRPELLKEILNLVRTFLQTQ